MKKIIYVTFLILFLIIFFEFFLKKNIILQNTISFLTANEKNYFLLIIICIVYFLSPLPVSPIILTTGFIFGPFGFFFIYPIIVIDSLIIFFLSKYLINTYFFKLF
mgnify:CR=1 FL=1